MKNEPLQLLEIALQANVPAILWGPPGVGKTSNIYATAERRKAHLETLIASIRDPSDFGGLPVRGTEGVMLEPMGWARRIKEANERGQEAIVFIDEISTAPPANQAALLRVILDKVVGDLDLIGAETDLVRMVAAANPPDQAAGGWELAPPLANRFFHIEWPAPDTPDWIEGYLQGWPNPDLVNLSRDPKRNDEALQMQKSLTAGYLNTQPQDLLNMPKNDEELGKAWPSPRTWEMMDKLVAVANASGLQQMRLKLVKGSIGEAVGKKYFTYLRDLNLPNPEDLLRDPDSLQRMERGDQLFATLTAVTYAVINGKKDNDRYTAGWKVLNRAAQINSVDIAAGAARRLAEYGYEEGLMEPEDAIDPFIPMLQDAGIIPS
jgi:MoxR-like ATPase